MTILHSKLGWWCGRDPWVHHPPSTCHFWTRSLGCRFQDRVGSVPATRPAVGTQRTGNRHLWDHLVGWSSQGHRRLRHCPPLMEERGSHVMQEKVTRASWPRGLRPEPRAALRVTRKQRLLHWAVQWWPHLSRSPGKPLLSPPPAGAARALCCHAGTAAHPPADVDVSREPPGPCEETNNLAPESGFFWKINSYELLDSYLVMTTVN